MTHSLLSRLCVTLLSLITLIIAGCHSVDDERIPYAEVRLTFATVGDWNRYGIGGAGDCKPFVYTRTYKTPTDYPYTSLDRTGYGGLLLAIDAMGNLVVYDLACPYEARADVRISVAKGSTYAECPHCHSTYELYTNYGLPISGPAASLGYALKRYSSHSGGALEYLVITR